MPPLVVTGLSRRDFVRAALATGGGALFDRLTAPGFGVPRPLGLPVACPDPFAGGRLIRTVPFAGSGTIRFHTLLDAGLDARLYTDLSALTPDTLVTPNDRYFVRTAFPDRLDPGAPWKIRVHGLVKQPVELTLRDLEPLVEPAGPYLMECAGNNDPAHFGLMSAARWAGAPVSTILRRAARPQATRVKISGFDGHSVPARSSLPGASWIFRIDELEAAGALLATQMNGEVLPREHGWPVRLVVPGWYGCACIKWVDDIELVDDSAPATVHMREFARRTFQAGIPSMARDYRPASLDLAAMPVRVEQWLVNGRILYRVVGIVWGGTTITSQLRIRFDRSEPYRPVDVCPMPITTLTWSLWSCEWRPAAPGRYLIALQAADSTIPAERLEIFFYTRRVWIEEV